MHTIRKNGDNYDIGIYETVWILGASQYISGYNDPQRGWVNSYTKYEPSQPSSSWRTIASAKDVETALRLVNYLNGGTAKFDEHELKELFR
jgi:hypothetical protein